MKIPGISFGLFISSLSVYALIAIRIDIRLILSQKLLVWGGYADVNCVLTLKISQSHKISLEVNRIHKSDTNFKGAPIMESICTKRTFGNSLLSFFLSWNASIHHVKQKIMISSCSFALNFKKSICQRSNVLSIGIEVKEAYFVCNLSFLASVARLYAIEYFVRHVWSWTAPP